MSAPYSLWDNPLSKGVKAGFTNAGENGRFNLALHAGGKPDEAVENRKTLCRSLEIPFEAYTCADQVHGNRVTLVTAESKGRGRLSHEDALPASDALITNKPGIMLNIFVADCVPIILFDPRTCSGGLVHGGWRGSSELIVQKTVLAMKKNFGSQAEDIQAFIGPSVGGCCYRVGENVREAFEKHFSYPIDPFHTEGDKLYLDLKEANRLQLVGAGLKTNNIKVSPTCTCCSEEPLFSYRKSGETAGRFSAFFNIK
ncbi:MAG: peptidoglycan editing factor PgeF [Spirochaetales bacterium]|nr:peptidoglycan editing factor PgeF [Spirochaetales bacterium]